MSCVFAYAAPNLGKLKLPHILDNKVGELESYQLKAAAKVLLSLSLQCFLHV